MPEPSSNRQEHLCVKPSMLTTPENKAHFIFHGALNDFLRKRQQTKPLTYSFKGSPAIKDAIEAIGVPHPEVDVLLVNRQPVTLRYRLCDRDEVEVYPVDISRSWPVGYSLEEQNPPPPRFVLDVHLGTLARSMRMLGLDASYDNNLSDSAIAGMAEEQQRVVLTRDIGLLKQKAVTWGYWLRSQHTDEQLEEVIRRFKLWDRFSPFERCLTCNVPVQEVSKEEVLEQLPPKTRLYFNEFFRCPSCRRVYWKGSHYDRMQQYLERISRMRE